MLIKNLYSKLPDASQAEILETILSGKDFKLERIVSKGQATKEGTWYDQDFDEWVILLKGSGGILFEGEHETLVLKEGDYIHIPARRKHRVEWTDQENETVWLALHFHK